jgi:hypothetical protein
VDSGTRRPLQRWDRRNLLVGVIVVGLDFPFPFGLFVCLFEKATIQCLWLSIQTQVVVVEPGTAARAAATAAVTTTTTNTHITIIITIIPALAAVAAAPV